MNDDKDDCNEGVALNKVVESKTISEIPVLSEVISNKHLLWNHANQGACSTEVCISECDRLYSLLKVKKTQKNFYYNSLINNNLKIIFILGQK